MSASYLQDIQVSYRWVPLLRMAGTWVGCAGLLWNRPGSQFNGSPSSPSQPSWLPSQEGLRRAAQGLFPRLGGAAVISQGAHSLSDEPLGRGGVLPHCGRRETLKRWWACLSLEQRSRPLALLRGEVGEDEEEVGEGPPLTVETAGSGALRLPCLPVSRPGASPRG